MFAKISILTVMSMSLIGGITSANAGGFTTSPRETAPIERSAYSNNVDAEPTGSITREKFTIETIKPYNQKVGVKSLRIQSITPYDPR